MATSERRITRSQARCRGPKTPLQPSSSSSSSGARSSAKKLVEGTPSLAAMCSSRSSPLMSKSASVTGDDGAGLISRSGRRVLADLAGNDSPVIGLFPAADASSPSSRSKLNPNCASKPKSRRALLGSVRKDAYSCTPIGESLLRSQVQKLLQKDAIQAQSPSPLSLPSSSSSPSPSLLSGSKLLDTSDSTLTMESAAPTPRMPSASFSRLTDLHYQSRRRDCYESVQDSREPSQQSEAKERHLHSKKISEITITESVRSGCDTRVLQLTPLATDQVTEKSVAATTGGDCQVLQITPLISEVVDIAIATDVFLGKRVLQFDSPDKDPEAKQLSDTVLPSANHEFEDDDASEWSMYVNLGSPEVEKEGSAERKIKFSGKDDCTVRLLAFEEHVQKMQQQPSMSKVDLLWDQREDNTHEYSEDNTDEDESRNEGYNKLDLKSSRNGTPYRKPIPEEEEEDYGDDDKTVKILTSTVDVLRRIEEGRSIREDNESEYNEEEEEMYDDHGEEEEEEEEYFAENCDSLCLQFSSTNFFEDGEERRRLPRGVGQHLRFLYSENGDDDEISEAMVVTGQEAMEGSLCLRGLPVHRGRHWRFAEEDDDGDDDEE